jgi:hypothetical protein
MFAAETTDVSGFNAAPWRQASVTSAKGQKRSSSALLMLYIDRILTSSHGLCGYLLPPRGIE